MKSITLGAIYIGHGRRAPLLVAHDKQMTKKELRRLAYIAASMRC